MPNRGLAPRRQHDRHRGGNAIEQVVKLFQAGFAVNVELDGISSPAQIGKNCLVTCSTAVGLADLPCPTRSSAAPRERPNPGHAAVPSMVRPGIERLNLDAVIRGVNELLVETAPPATPAQPAPSTGPDRPGQNPQPSSSPHRSPHNGTSTPLLTPQPTDLSFPAKPEKRNLRKLIDIHSIVCKVTACLKLKVSMSPHRRRRNVHAPHAEPFNRPPCPQRATAIPVLLRMPRSSRPVSPR